MKMRLSICLLTALLTTVVLADDPKAARPSMDTSARLERRQLHTAAGDHPALQKVIVDGSNRRLWLQNRLRPQRSKTDGHQDLLFTLQSMQGLQPVVARVRSDGDDGEHDKKHSASIKGATLGAHRDVSCGAKDADPKW